MYRFYVIKSLTHKSREISKPREIFFEGYNRFEIWRLLRQHCCRRTFLYSLQWRHNECDGVSNHRCLKCLLKRFFRHRSKKTSKFRVTGLCEGISPVTVNSPHKWPVTRKMFPFFMTSSCWHLIHVAEIEKSRCHYECYQWFPRY